MQTEQPITHERLAHDPVYAHATATAKSLIDTRPPKTIESVFRSNYARYLSPTHRLRYLDALRKELTVRIDNHRPGCPYPNDPQCIQERAYAASIEMARDELAMINPAIAARHESQSFSKIEANQINAVLNTMAEQLSGMESSLNVLTTSSQFTYDDILGLLEDMKDKLPYGKKDWFDLFRTRLTNVGIDEAIRASIVAPALTTMGELIVNTIDPSNL